MDNRGGVLSGPAMREMGVVSRTWTRCHAAAATNTHGLTLPCHRPSQTCLYICFPFLSSLLLVFPIHAWLEPTDLLALVYPHLRLDFIRVFRLFLPLFLTFPLHAWFKPVSWPVLGLHLYIFFVLVSLLLPDFPIQAWIKVCEAMKGVHNG